MCISIKLSPSISNGSRLAVDNNLFFESHSILSPQYRAGSVSKFENACSIITFYPETADFAVSGGINADPPQSLLTSGKAIAAMAWCEDNGVDYIFGLPGNTRLAARAPRRSDEPGLTTSQEI